MTVHLIITWLWSCPCQLISIYNPSKLLSMKESCLETCKKDSFFPYLMNNWLQWDRKFFKFIQSIKICTVLNSATSQTQPLCSLSLHLLQKFSTRLGCKWKNVSITKNNWKLFANNLNCEKWLKMDGEAWEGVGKGTEIWMKKLKKKKPNLNDGKL